MARSREGAAVTSDRSRALLAEIEGAIEVDVKTTVTARANGAPQRRVHTRGRRCARRRSGRASKDSGLADWRDGKTPDQDRGGGQTVALQEQTRFPRLAKTARSERRSTVVANHQQVTLNVKDLLRREITTDRGDPAPGKADGKVGKKSRVDPIMEPPKVDSVARTTPKPVPKSFGRQTATGA